jgi:hypothetical protein
MLFKYNELNCNYNSDFATWIVIHFSQLILSLISKVTLILEIFCNFSKCTLEENYLFWRLIIQRVQNADIGISHHSMDSQAPKKEHLMKSGIPTLERAITA